MVKNLPAMQESQVQALGQEDPLEEETATHSSILAWRIPWIEDPGGLPSMGSQRVRHNWRDLACPRFLSCLADVKTSPEDVKCLTLEPIASGLLEPKDWECEPLQHHPGASATAREFFTSWSPLCNAPPPLAFKNALLKLFQELGAFWVYHRDHLLGPAVNLSLLQTDGSVCLASLCVDPVSLY